MNRPTNPPVNEQLNPQWMGQSARHSRTRPWIIALIVATCLRVWIGPAPMVPTAQAQIPNAGTQRLKLITEVRKTNELLLRIATMLETGTLKVDMAGTDKHLGQGASTRGK